MPTIKHVNLPQPLEETLRVPPRSPAVKRKQQDGPKGEWTGPRYAPLPWNPMPYMDDFLTELYARECKHDYIRMVKVGLSHFATFMAVKEVRHPDEITRQHLLHFQAWLQTEARTEEGNPFSVSYRRKLMCYVRSWVKWMVDLEHVEHDPWVRIKVTRTPKQPKPLGNDEIALLFETHRRQAFTMSPFAWHRQEVILVLLYAWGLRIHELQSLNLVQMDMRLSVVRIKNKGTTRPKPLPYTDTVKQSVQRYLVWRAKEAEDGEDALLVEATHGGRLSIQRARQVVVDLGYRAGVPINPHRLRDSFGTTMVNSGAEIEHVQVMMGHSQREMTMAYVDLADQRVTDTHQQIMGPMLDGFMAETTTLPDGIDEPPPGWPKQPVADKLPVEDDS